MYNVGFIGTGNTSIFFLRGWQHWSAHVRIAALCDVVPQQMEHKQQLFPELCSSSQLFTDYRQMLREVPLDIICICSYSDQHLEHTAAALEAGCHVFVEKPTGYNLEEARRLAYLAARHPDKKVSVAYSLRYRKAFMDFKALIASGVLGRLYTAEISYSHPHFDPPQSSNDSTSSNASDHHQRLCDDRGLFLTDDAGNYIASSQLTRSTHPWDLARYLLGEVRECFSAQGVSMLPQMGILWMESGALCHVLAGVMRRPKVGGNQHQMVQVHGDKGSAWLVRDYYEPYEQHAFYRTDGEIQTAPSICDLPDSSHGTVIRSKNLLDAIEGKAHLICSLLDAVRTTELLHALWLSERMQVKVPVMPGNITG